MPHCTWAYPTQNPPTETCRSATSSQSALLPSPRPSQDRVHRMGQTREVEVFRYVAADTIEERMVQLQVGVIFIYKCIY